MKIRLKPDPIVLYTDGSCYPNPGPGGWAVVREDEDKHTTVASGMDILTTNIKMEGIALRVAIDYLAVNGSGVIYTDSELWVKIITDYANKWQADGWKKPNGPIKNLVLVKQLWGEYKLANRFGREVKLEWVKGHAGIPGNEAVDVVAGEQRVLATQIKSRLAKESGVAL